MIAPDDPRRGGTKAERRPPPGKARPSSFGHKDKLVAVVASEVNGIPETARALRISQKALQSWRDEAVLLPYVEATRNQIMGDAATVAEKAWAELLMRLQNEAEKFSTRDLVVVAAEATNKMQLLSGGATSRTETKDVTDHFDEAQTQEIVNAARRYLERNGPGARSALAQGPRLEIPATTEPDPA
jgi:hypothetical protein